MLRSQDGGITVHGAVVGEAEERRLGDADDFPRLPLDALPLGTAGVFTFCAFGTFGFFTLGALGALGSLTPCLRGRSIFGPLLSQG